MLESVLKMVYSSNQQTSVRVVQQHDSLVGFLDPRLGRRVTETDHNYRSKIQNLAHTAEAAASSINVATI